MKRKLRPEKASSSSIGADPIHGITLTVQLPILYIIISSLFSAIFKISMSKKKKVVFIFGPTGVGKTEVAGQVARDIGEIISVDSMQVYKGLDCGTAKPDDQALQSVPYHLIDIVSPDYRFSAGDFRRLAIAAIDEIHSRVKIPILVGGTGLYFRALEYNLSLAPPADVELRQSLYREEESRKGLLYEKLLTIDPDTAVTVHSNDLIRIVRALEIYYLSGLKFSDFIDKKPEAQFDTLKFGLNIDRRLLYERLEYRCRKMVKNGLAREVYQLLMRGYDERYPSMKGLGYSHFIQYLKGCSSYGEVLRLFIRDTKRYAKRQITWFRKETRSIWFNPDDYRIIREKIEHFIEQ